MKKKQTDRALQAAPTGLRVFRWSVVAVTVIVGVAGLMASGSPQQERARRLDEQRVNDLEQISYAVDQFYGINKVIPNSLEDLQNSRNVYIRSISDPETGAPYEYSTQDDRHYTLCAVFASESQQDLKSDLTRGNAFWTHGQGRACFDFETPTLDTGKPPAPVRALP